MKDRTFGERLLAICLRAYPRVFRERFGSEILGDVQEQYARARERGLWPGLFGVAGNAFDLVLSGLTERWRPNWSPAGGIPGGIATGVEMTIGNWARDLGLAVRTLGRSPGFTAASTGTLALALGVTAAIFGVVDAVLLRPFPYQDADRLVYIAASAPGSDLPAEFAGGAEFFVHYGQNAKQLESLASFGSFTGTVRAGDRVERLRQSTTSLSLFQTLGVTPLLGRLAREEEAGQVALISHGLWTTWFGADPTVLGRTYEFYDGSKEVIGVMPPDFRFPSDDVVAWVPEQVVPAEIVPGRFGGYPMVGRLAEGADLESLSRELAGLAKQLPDIYGGTSNYARMIEQHVPVVRTVREELLGDVTGPLWILMGAVLVVLLVACANVVSLFSVRSEGRGRDVAVRRALGADRRALVRSELSESLVIGALAGGCALLLAWVALPLFVRVAPQGIPRIADVAVSPLTLLVTAAASAFAALACGLAPSLRSSNPDLARLREGARGSTSGRRHVRNALVVAQTALALTLLIGSGLLFRSFQQLRRVDPGYDTSDILTFQFAPDQAHLTDGPTWARFHLEFMQRLRALPGVEMVGIVENVPLDEGLGIVPFATEDAPTDPPSGPRVNLTFAGGDYFGAMGIDVLRGRAFGDEDVLTPGNVVISEAAAEQLWPGENPVGKQLRNVSLTDWHTVVGVVEDIRQYDLRNEPDPVVYYPLVGPTPTSWRITSPGYVVRTARADVIAPDIRALIREVAPEAPMYRVHTMTALVDRSMVGLSFMMLTLVVAAGLGLVLGAVGLYGVLSYVVTERTREIGIRMALGAEARRVRGTVVAQGARIVAVGIALGLVLAYFAARALSGLLYGVAPADPWTFAATALAMAAVGVLASWLPAYRASKLDPTESMRGG